MSFPDHRIGNINSLINYQTENHQNEAETNLVQKSSSWQQKLPYDLIQNISFYLNPKELGVAIKVCKLWADLINNNNYIWSEKLFRFNFFNIPAQLKTALFDHRSMSVTNSVFDVSILRLIYEYTEYSNSEVENAKDQFANPKPAIAFGRQEYIDYDLGDPGEVPPLPANIHEILQSPCEFWPGKRVEETHALVLIVPGSINSLDQRVKKAGNGIGIDYFGRAAKQELGDKKVEKPYWALMTKDVIPGSRGKNSTNQKTMVEAKGYEVPNIYEATSVALTEYLRSGKRLFSDRPCTYTRCKEKIQDFNMTIPMTVGGFGTAGLYVLDKFSDIIIGVAALRKVNAKC